MALHACHFPTWALNRLQYNFEHRHYNNNEPSSTDSQLTNNHNNNGTSNNNNNKNISMAVPYIQGLGRSSKGHVTGKAYKYTLSVQIPTELFLWHPKTRTPNFRKAGSYTNTGTHKLTVLRSILERLAEHLGTGSKNISGPIPHPTTYQFHRTSNQP